MSYDYNYKIKYNKYKQKYLIAQKNLKYKQIGGGDYEYDPIDNSSLLYDYHDILESSLEDKSENNNKYIVEHHFLPIKTEALYEGKSIESNKANNITKINRILESVHITWKIDDISYENIVFVSIGSTSTQCYDGTGHVIFTSQHVGYEYLKSITDSEYKLNDIFNDLYNEIDKYFESRVVENKLILYINAISYITLTGTDKKTLNINISQPNINSFNDKILFDKIYSIILTKNNYTNIISSRDSIYKIENDWSETFAKDLFNSLVSKGKITPNDILCTCDFGGGGVSISECIHKDIDGNFMNIPISKSISGLKHKIIIPNQQKFASDMLFKNFYNLDFEETIISMKKQIILMKSHIEKDSVEPISRKMYIFIGQTGKLRAMYYNLKNPKQIEKFVENLDPIEYKNKLLCLLKKNKTIDNSFLNDFNDLFNLFNLLQY